MDSARGKSCIACGNDDGTVVRAHYNGMYQLRLGKGVGTKGHDLFGAHLCMRCHSSYDQYKGGSSAERDRDFLFLCCLTILRDVQDGLITIKGHKP